MKPKINEKATLHVSKKNQKTWWKSSNTLPKISRKQIAAVKAMINRLLCVMLINVLYSNLGSSQQFDIAIKLRLNLLRQLTTQSMTLHH